MSHTKWLRLSSFAIALVALCLSVEFCVYGSVLWRDETGCVNIANEPTLRQVWQSLQFDSAPLGWFIALRAWCAAGLSSDTSLRMLGALLLAIGIAALFANARANLGIWPVASLALLAANPLFYRYGMSTRCYGLSMALTALAIGLAAASLRRPDKPMLRGLASGAALAMMQANYFGAIVGIVIAVAVVAASRQPAPLRLRHAALLLLPGLVSMTPYILTLNDVSRWKPLLNASVSPAYALVETIVTLVDNNVAVLAALAAFIACAGFLAARAAKIEKPSEPDYRFGVFWTVLCLGSAAGFCLYVYALRYPVYNWHCLPLILIIAMGMDALFSRVTGWKATAAVAVPLIAMFAAGVSNAVQDLKTPQSNVDLCAAAVAQQTCSADLVVANPWFYGISLARYYQGPAPLIAAPLDVVPNCHRLDQAKLKEAAEKPMEPALSRMAAALRAGHAVVIVGAPLDSTTLAQRPLSRAPDPISGWDNNAYVKYWTRLEWSFMLQHARACVQSRPVGVWPPVSFENMYVYRFTGWR